MARQDPLLTQAEEVTRMAQRKDTEGQLSLDDYQLKQVDVRLKLMDGPAYYSTTPLTTPETAAMVMRDVMKDLDREWVCVVNMDNHLKPVNYNIVSIGSINSSIAPIQNIMKSAMLSNCNNLLLMHNHPSGEVDPSNEDVALTKRLLAASKLMEMNLVDHLIIGGQTGEVYSFCAENPFEFHDRGIDMDYIRRMIRSEDASLADGGAVYRPKTFDPKKAAEERKAELKTITEQLEKGVKGVFESDRYKQFLDTMAKFPNYSVNNSLLIMMQRPDASLVQSYTGWKQMGRFVKRGEKGIRILAPAPYRVRAEQERLGPDGHTVIGSDGKPETEKVEVERMSFKPVSTFDISQTEGEPLPELARDLTDPVEGYDDYMDAIRSVSPVPIRFDEIRGTAKGYYDPAKREIVLQRGMPEEQTVKTAVHECAHALLGHGSKGDTLDRSTHEVQAESVAYCCCKALGLDTADYSFGYIAGWSSGRDMKELKASMQTIREQSEKMISGIRAKMDQVMEMRAQKMSAPQAAAQEIHISMG